MALTESLPRWDYICYVNATFMYFVANFCQNFLEIYFDCNLIQMHFDMVSKEAKIWPVIQISLPKDMWEIYSSVGYNGLVT